MKTPSSEKKLAEMVIKILDIKANKGCEVKKWEGFTNGNREEIGKDIDKIIKLAKRILKNK